MNNNKEQLRLLKRLTLVNYFIVASLIIACGYWIGKQTHHQTMAWLIILFFLTAGLVCSPMVYRVSQMRLEKFRKYSQEENNAQH